MHLRVGGGTSRAGPRASAAIGASPRGRRNPTSSSSKESAARCISAWAEEPKKARGASAKRAVHLRVGGGTPAARRVTRPARGASPRGRRNRCDLRSISAAARCISAWAEEPATRPASTTRKAVHLRVGGGTCRTNVTIRPKCGASPRGRRNLGDATSGHMSPRCISAWAEEPPYAPPYRVTIQVHLRVGGGTRTPSSASSAAIGASPRGRRNRAIDAATIDGERCISAWAEEPTPRAR